MGKRKRTKQVRLSEADKQRAHEAFIQRWSTFKETAKVFLICTAFVSTAYVVFYLPVTVAPGEHTSVSLKQGFIANVNTSVWIAWGAAATMGLALFREHHHRLKERNEKDKRLREFEKIHDPEVSGSGLTVDGKHSRGDSK